MASPSHLAYFSRGKKIKITNKTECGYLRSLMVLTMSWVKDLLDDWYVYIHIYIPTDIDR